MNQAYAKAIDLLTADNVDYKAVAIALAKQNPELFCSLAAGAGACAFPATGWHREVVEHIRSNHKVSAIKLCREKTGFGLKEAKDIIDDVSNRDLNLWFRSDLCGKQFDVYKEIISYL